MYCFCGCCGVTGSQSGHRLQRHGPPPPTHDTTPNTLTHSNTYAHAYSYALTDAHAHACSDACTYTYPGADSIPIDPEYECQVNFLWVSPNSLGILIIMDFMIIHLK